MRYVDTNFVFPTCIVVADNSLLVTEEIVNVSRNLCFEHNGKPFYGNCTSTIKTLDNVLELDTFAEIKKEIVKAVDVYCKTVNLDATKLQIRTSWLNYYDIHGYQDLHLHPSSVLSGVFYIKAAGTEDLVFQAPWNFFQPVPPVVSKSTLENRPQLSYKSKPGRCYIFPSHLMHQTLPASSERMSLAFNLTYV